VKISKPLLAFFVTISFISCVSGYMGEIGRPLLANEIITPQQISYSPQDALSSPSGSMARNKKIRMACYPVGGECTKNSDCCTGFCRSGLSTAYCDNP